MWKKKHAAKQQSRTDDRRNKTLRAVRARKKTEKIDDKETISKPKKHQPNKHTHSASTHTRAPSTRFYFFEKEIEKEEAEVKATQPNPNIHYNDQKKHSTHTETCSNLGSSHLKNERFRLLFRRMLFLSQSA